jgi:predicted enzyme involved in methoxymalonyl-ACP biosynthesis
MQTSDPRKEIDSLIEAGDATRAARLLSILWERDGGSALAGFVVSRYEKLRNRLRLVPYRLAVLRSFTVEPLAPLMRAAAFARGIDLETHIGEFNAYAQEILDGESALYRFRPDAVVLAVQTRDVAPGLWRDYARLGESERAAEAESVLGRFRGWVRAFREHSRAALMVHSLETPAAPGEGVLDGQAEENQAEAIRRINRGLRALAREHRGVYILDYDGLVARHASGSPCGCRWRRRTCRTWPRSGCGSCIRSPERWPSASRWTWTTRCGAG